MAGYLDQYGAGEEERNRIIIGTVVAIVVIAVVGTLGWYLLENRHQESVVKTFLRDLRGANYPAAYRDWGCVDEKTCSGYSFEKFKEDWAPQAKDAAPDPSVLGLTDSESCNNGVLLTVAVNGQRQEKLWVDRSSDRIGFAPYPICPHKSPFAIMIHRTVGKLRKPLLH
jgi:hypothetical protein